MARPRKEYAVDGFAGCAKRLKLPVGLTVGLYATEQAGFTAADGGHWATVCEDHGGIVQYELRRDAEAFLSHPEEWCPTCQGNGE